MNKAKELPFEPAPKSLADVDYMLFIKYLEVCKETETQPSVKDYLVWLEDNDIVTEE